MLELPDWVKALKEDFPPKEDETNYNPPRNAKEVHPDHEFIGNPTYDKNEMAPRRYELFGMKKKSVFVFNAVDHESIVAARLYFEITNKNLGGIEDTELAMVDIRDTLPAIKDATYFFIGCGDKDSLMSYYQRRFRPETLAEIFKRARFIQTSRAGIFYDTLIYKVIEHACEADFESLAKKDDDGVLATTVLAHHYNQQGLSYFKQAFVEEEGAMKEKTVPEQENFYPFVQYVNYLNETYNRYYGFSNKYQALTPGSYMKQEQILGRKLGDFVSNVMVNGQCFAQVVTTNPAIYSLLRRLKQANRKFIHVSTGMYGEVVYCPYPMDKRELSNYNGLVIQ